MDISFIPNEVATEYSFISLFTKRLKDFHSFSLPVYLYTKYGKVEFTYNLQHLLY